MTKKIENICYNIGIMIFECSELLANVVVDDESLNEYQKQAARGTVSSLIACYGMVSTLKKYNQQEAEKGGRKG